MGRMASDEARMRSLALGFSGARIAVGAMAILTPRAAVTIMGFPRSQDTPTARLTGRLFGIREIALGAYTAVRVQRSVDQPQLYGLNACVDAADFAVCTATLVGRRGVGRAAFGSALLAAPFAATWLWLRGSCQG